MKRKRKRVSKRKPRIAHKLLKVGMVIILVLFVGATLILFTTGQWPTAIWAVEEATRMLGEAWSEMVAEA